MPEWLNLLLRSISLVFIILFLTKYLGKKHISQLSIFDYINGFVVGGIISIVAVNIDVNYWYGIMALIVWFVIPYLIDLLGLKVKGVREFIHGKSKVIIKDGKIMEENLKKELFSSDDLLVHLRDRNIFRVADVEFALLEPTGKISVLPKAEKQPLTPQDIGLKVAPMKEPQTVIMDGKILLEPLATLKLNPRWLETELAKLNVSIENVFLGQVDSDGQLTVDLYDDKIVVPEPTEKPLLLATLKKSQADLELFALATENKQSKQIYEKNAAKVAAVIEKIEPFLK